MTDKDKDIKKDKAEESPTEETSTEETEDNLNPF